MHNFLNVKYLIFIDFKKFNNLQINYLKFYSLLMSLLIGNGEKKFNKMLSITESKLIKH